MVNYWTDIGLVSRPILYHHLVHIACLSARYCKQHLTEWYSFAIGIKSDRYCHKSFPFNKIFDLILYVPSTIFQLYRDESSWVEPVLSWDKCVLLKDHNAVTPVRLEPAALRSRVKHSTTEPLRSQNHSTKWLNLLGYMYLVSTGPGLPGRWFYLHVWKLQTFKILNWRN